MPPPPILNRTFKLTALRANATGVAGAQVRLLNATGLDVTAGFFNNPTHTTDSQGVFERSLSLFSNTPPAGLHTIQVIARGFELWSFQTNFTFNGSGTFTANLVAAARQTDYTLVSPGSSVAASSMVPLVYQVVSTNPDLPWEIIRAQVDLSSGTSSTIEAIVDKADSTARIDVRNRLHLGIRPLLVAGADLTREDTDFSATAEVSFSALSEEGESPIAGTFLLRVAASLPDEGRADLSNYIDTVARKWLVPATPVIAFRGYYRDVMVWLPDEADYELHVQYYNAANQVIGNLTAPVPFSELVQRVRIDTDPGQAVTRAELTVLIVGQNDPATETLTVLYRD